MFVSRVGLWGITERKTDLIKAIFFDVDGTLLRFGAHELTPAIRQALLKIQASGIKLFLASGRAPYLMPDLGIPFDGYVAFNGAYYHTPGASGGQALDKDDIRILLENAADQKVGLALASAQCVKATAATHYLVEYFEKAGQTVELIDDERLLTQPIYQVMVGLPVSHAAELLANTQNMTAVAWWHSAFDVILKNGGKHLGMSSICEHYGWSVSEVMACGDGGNDLTMIEQAGIGIAMANGVEELKQAANFVCPSVDEDGLLEAFQKYGII